MPDRDSAQQILNNRAATVADILAAVIEQRLAGAEISDEAVIAARPDLMPRLRQELRELAQVEYARRHAQGADSSVPALADWVRPAGGLEVAGYEIREELSRGGQGVVYRALQRSTGREVALKVMRAGPFSGPHDRARFEREVHILARLRHPNIVTIHDSGVAGGFHYFVMDYVDGRPLDRFVREANSPGTDAAASPAGDRTAGVRPTVALFALLCEALHAAHLRGVIHRDLKPGNVLVDAQGQPHILDFGLAKLDAADDSGAAELTEMTHTGQFLGSLPWASPEQAQGRGDLDVRTDVYQIGVMLYQCLAGQFPYAVTGDPRTVLNHIVELEPTPLARVAPQVDADTATIVGKCLQKDRERRYQGAGELARDLRHVLNDEPIEARRDSSWYVLRKQLHRYRLVVAASAAAVVGSLGFAIAMTWLYARALAAEDEARRGWKAAEVQVDKTQRTAQFLPVTLALVDPTERQDHQFTFRQVLDHAAEVVQSHFSDDPEIESAIRGNLGEMYSTMGDDDTAVAQFEKALALRRAVSGPTDPLTRESERQLAKSEASRGRNVEAEPLARAAFDGLRDQLGANDPRTLRAADTLAGVLIGLKRYGEAEALIRGTLGVGDAAFGADNPDVSAAWSKLAFIRGLDPAGLEEAVQILQSIGAARESHLGPKHALTLQARQDLATFLLQKQRFAEAEPLMRANLELSREINGSKHRSTVVALNDLGFLCQRQGRSGEAEVFFREGLELQTVISGPDHPLTINALTSLAELLRIQERHADCVPLLIERANAMLRTRQPPDWDTIYAVHNVATTYVRLDQPADAESWFRRAHELSRNVRGEDDDRTVLLFMDVMGALRRQGRFEEAASGLRQKIDHLDETSGGNVGLITKLREGLAKVYREWGRPDEAAEALAPSRK